MYLQKEVSKKAFYLRIRIRTNMSQIQNTAYQYFLVCFYMFSTLKFHANYVCIFFKVDFQICFHDF
jgi:hypothetical protein